SKRNLVTSLLWWILGAIACAVLHFLPAFPGFIGGLVFAVYALSLFPAMVRAAGRQPPGRTLFVAMLVYNLLALAHVWIVAYAFVPGGPLLREHNDYVLIAMMACIFIG